MPYKREGRCVYKEGTKKPIKCHKTKQKAIKHLTALNLNVTTEIKDYFSSMSDPDYKSYDDHPLSTIENLMNEDVEAPWDEEYEKYLQKNKENIKWHT